MAQAEAHSSYILFASSKASAMVLSSVRVLRIFSFASSSGVCLASVTSSTLIICHPKPVLTRSLISPAEREKAASSKGFTILPGEKVPRSPPRSLVGPSEYFRANAAKSSFSLAFSRQSAALFLASSTCSGEASSGSLKRICRAFTLFGVENSSVFNS